MVDQPPGIDRGRAVFQFIGRGFCEKRSGDCTSGSGVRDHHLHGRDVQQPRLNVEAFVKDRPEVFIFPNAYDEERWLAQTFRVNATPTYIVLDAQGRIALTHRGGGVLQNPRFQQFLSALKG